ncbi:prepilin-type N-terminal cleavage/methylation domain-containing protein [Collimonas sp. OK607]|nr:prepilin-type N-terminal cleavage/methylation domain-containing protein [Collimonas sp. OK607]SFB25494.1 prepilin-type N-terminal cleavage/methylation domain-containing protein [Collimonas sp. OK607]
MRNAIFPAIRHRYAAVTQCGFALIEIMVAVLVGMPGGIDCS